MIKIACSNRSEILGRRSHYHFAVVGPLNPYNYVSQNPWTKFDPEGLSDIEIIQKDTVKTHLHNPTDKQFRDAIGKMKDHSIEKITITGHGNAFEIDTGEHGSKDQGISISGMNAKGQWQVTFNDGGNVGDFLKPKMAEKSQIHLNGCNAGNDREWLPLNLGSKNNIAKVLSQNLPEVEVTGNRGFSLSNQLSNPFNRTEALPPIGGSLHEIGIPRTYSNGQEK